MGQPNLHRLRDAAVPAALGAVLTAEVIAVGPPSPGWTLAVELLGCLALLLRRRRPLLTGVLAVGVLVLPFVGPFFDDLVGPVFIVWVAGYGLGRRLPDLRGLPVACLYLAVPLTAFVVVGDGADVGILLWVGTLLGPPYVIGVLVRRWDVRVRELAAQTARLELAQEQVRRETAAAERARIARELHDVLAHSVSAMVLQVSAAEDLVRTDPERAERVLGEVAAVGRRALSETGRLLHLVRDTDGELGLDPDAGLSRLPELVAGCRRGGMEVELSIAEPLERLPAGVDLSAYRVVQEALTNAQRHGTGDQASVSVVRRASALEIRVSNPVGPSRAATAGSGLGLLGIAERVAVFGGSLDSDLTADGRYELTATLPVPEDRP